MTNISQRKSYLSNLFNIKKLTNIFIQENKDIRKTCQDAINDYKNEWAVIPRYEKNDLSLDTLLKEKKYQWLSKVNMWKYHELLENHKPEEIIDNFITTALNRGLSLIDLCSEVQDKPISRKPLMSVDLETTGLDVTYFKIGGRTVHTCYITGICLAFLDEDFIEHSTYIPVLHTESDGIPNLPYKKALESLTKIKELFSPIYHNSVYDRDVCTLNGVTLKSIGGFFDTLIIANQTDLCLDPFVRLGLKELSKDVLNREQITLSMVDADSIGYHNLAYSEMWIYGTCLLEDEVEVQIRICDC